MVRIKAKSSTCRRDKDQSNNIQVYICVYPIMHVHGHMHVDTKKITSFAPSMIMSYEMRFLIEVKSSFISRCLPFTKLRLS